MEAVLPTSGRAPAGAAAVPDRTRTRKRDHGRAEAALIALFGIRASRLMAAPTGAQTGLINELIQAMEKANG